MPDRDTRKPVPNVRGEDEDELQCLVRIIEGTDSLARLANTSLLVVV